MPEYFIVRSSTDVVQKKWILSEINSGRLRQGWFAHKGTALISKTNEPRTEKSWTSSFREVVRETVRIPTTQRDKKFRTASFAEQKYKELMRLLDISEGDMVIVPKLDGSGGENGFVIARAAKAQPTSDPSRGCYWFDLQKRTATAPSDDYRHVVSIDRNTIRIIAHDSSTSATKIVSDLKSRRAPIVHSRDSDFNERMERLYLETAPQTGKFSGKPLTGKAERQERDKVKGDISRRRGQPAFRQKLLDAYERCCAISGCDAVDALEAAHVRTFQDEDDNDVRNGLLLRADLHTMFDLGLISIQTSNWKVIVAPHLRKTTYGSLHRKPLKKLPADERLWPKEALDYRRQNRFSNE